MASLFVIQGRDQGQRFELEDIASSIGREVSNSIQIHDTEVSRQHAEVRQEDDGFTLIDLESSNGTFVNSNKISRHVLHSGDRVQVSSTLMIFTGTSGHPSAELSEVISVVPQPSTDGSRIIRSLRHEDESDIFGGDEPAPTPWLARARSNLQIMYRTALAVSHTLDIDQLLERILELIFEWVECDRGCVLLVDEETGELMPMARRTRRGVDKKEKIAISRTILEYVMDQKEGVLTSDARDDQRWDPAGSILKMGVREAICVPLQGRYGIVGVVYIDTYTPPSDELVRRRTTRFSEEHLKLMVAIGHQAALAVEDTSYYSAMVQAERLAAIGQTIATLSHHIKNILQGIRGGSYLIEEGLKMEKTDVVQKGWGIVDRNQEKISNLVLDMLTFSKEREPDPTPSDINRIAGDVVELMTSRAEEMNVGLTWKPQEDIPTLVFDSDMLHRAILNVVTNAIDACGDVEGGIVEVSTEYKPLAEVLSVSISDNGTGIEPEDLTKIFTVFESRKGSRGTGLGLPVSQKILNEHGGDIIVTSELGKGSCFRLELPGVVPTPDDDTGTTVAGM